MGFDFRRIQKTARNNHHSAQRDQLPFRRFIGQQIAFGNQLNAEHGSL